ncbi:MAG: MmgE/PrpD family protein [Candidatus Rokubacteria bacterium]|nr:MmgE/PrpD family protein [Candidatus Rokubacteria bacterium]
MSATVRLAEFVTKTSLDDCPAGALEAVRRAALDSVGVMLAGAAEPVARIVREVARAEGGVPLATVIGSRLRTSTTWAALANGAAGHAHDFDDTSFALMGHPSVPLFAAVLAAAEAVPADGRAVALAYLLGFEVGATLGQAVTRAHYARGWHATATIGTVGCAAAVARLHGLDAGEKMHALAIAASLASGLKENFGSMTKPYHAGHAARNGVLAALLAREGMTGSVTALEGPQGYLRAFGSDRPALDALDGLGRHWHVVTSRVAVKPYPSCALTHSAIDSLLELRQRHGLAPEQIAEVEVGVNQGTPAVLMHPEPVTALQRKFSLQFCAAAALADGRVDFASFAAAEPAAPVRALMRRVRMVVDPGIPRWRSRHAAPAGTPTSPCRWARSARNSRPARKARWPPVTWTAWPRSSSGSTSCPTFARSRRTSRPTSTDEHRSKETERRWESSTGSGSSSSRGCRRPRCPA